MNMEMPSKETTKSPKWCDIHYGWFRMCPHRIPDDSDWGDTFSDCIAAHNQKLREQIAQEIEAKCTPDDSGSVHAWQFNGNLQWKKCTCNHSALIARAQK